MRDLDTRTAFLRKGDWKDTAAAQATCRVLCQQRGATDRRAPARTLGVYEQNRIELLRDVFVWAYARSCAQYQVVRESMGQPDPLRLRYRAELAEVVRETVTSLAPPSRELLRAWAEEHGVPPGDRDAFAERALSLLVSLHEGNAGRYRIRPSELSAWLTRHRS